MKKFVFILFLFGSVVFAGGTEEDIYADSEVRPGDQKLEEQSVEFVDDTLERIQEGSSSGDIHLDSLSQDDYRFVRVQEGDTVEDVLEALVETNPTVSLSEINDRTISFKTGDALVLDDDGEIQIVSDERLLPSDEFSDREELNPLVEESPEETLSSETLGSDASDENITQESSTEGEPISELQSQPENDTTYLPSLQDDSMTPSQEGDLLLKKILLGAIAIVLLMTFVRIFRSEKSNTPEN